MTLLSGAKSQRDRITVSFYIRESLRVRHLSRKIKRLPIHLDFTDCNNISTEIKIKYLS